MLIRELFQTLDNIFETNIAFGKMYVALEDQVEKRGRIPMPMIMLWIGKDT